MVSRPEIRERRRKRKQKQRMTTILVVVGVVFIMAAVLMMPTIKEALTPVGEFVQPELNPRPMANMNTMGDPNAPVVIEEYADFGCGYCAYFSETTGKQIVDTYVSTGQVYYIYNSVGSLLGHPNSIVTAEAAYCAGDQDMFWEYHDLIFANQTDLFSNINKKLDKTLMAYAEVLGLDLVEFESCVDSNKYIDVIQQDQVDAAQAGINSTPSLLVNGNLIIGSVSFEEFQTVIENEIEAATQ